MSNLKVGDKAVIVKEVCGHQFKIGEIVEIINCYPGCQNYETSNGSDSWHVVMREIKPYTDYLKSNRCTLSQLIKASEFKAIDLSVQMGKERTYLSSTASESRFNGRGDINQIKLDEIKLNMSLAETALKTKRDDIIVAVGFNPAESQDFTFDIPKEFGDENQTIDAWFKNLKTSEDASKAFIFLHKYIEKYGESLPNFEKDRLYFELAQKTREIRESDAVIGGGCDTTKFSKTLSDFERKKIDDDLDDIARDLWKDEESKKRDRWIYEKPKHNLNIFAILVTIAILVILFSIGYKYIF